MKPPTDPIDPKIVEHIVKSKNRGELQYAERRDGGADLNFVIRVPLEGSKRRSRTKTTAKLAAANWAIVKHALGWGPEPVFETPESERETVEAEPITGLGEPDSE